MNLDNPHPSDEGPLRCRQCLGDFAPDDEGELCFRCLPADKAKSNPHCMGGFGMTPEAQRIAIAEACGWEILPSVGTRFKSMVRRPLTEESKSTDWVVMPDYLNDLNAMHEAEKVLTEKQLGLFAKLLVDTVKPTSSLKGTVGFWVVQGRCNHATAAQRAEAFLRTLNLWKP